MAVAEELQAFKRRIAQRLTELEPLVKEYEEVRRVAAVLEIEPEPSRKATPPRAATSRAPKRAATRRPRARSKAATAGGTRALGAQRRARILEIVQQRPGVTVAELAEDLGIDRTSVHRLVRQLSESGEVQKENRGLKLA